MRPLFATPLLLALASAAGAQTVQAPVETAPSAPPRVVVVPAPSEAEVPPIVGEGEVAADGSGQPLESTDFAETGLSSPTHTAATPDIGPGIGPTGLIRPDITREGFAAVDFTTMDLTQLLGVRVYDINDERIGEVDRWIGGGEGALPEGAVIDVGGFLGLGERPVAVELSAMTVLAGAEGDDLRVYVDATEDRLEALPEWLD